MAILGNFEITILTPTVAVSKITGLLERQWLPLTEYSPLRSDELSGTNCHKYVGLPAPLPLPSPEEQLSLQHYQYTNSYGDTIASLVPNDAFSPSTDEELLEFAIDYKVHCGFSFLDPNEADLIIFRTYLDGERIGSGLIKRERWERSGSYRVRKRGKRVWTGNSWDGQWVQQKWVFEPGRHGTLTVEAWRENEDGRCSRGGALFGAPNSANAVTDFMGYDEGRVTIDLTGLGDDLRPLETVIKTPRVKRTKKVDMWPMATFVFDYRTEDTLRTLGIIRESTTADNDNNDIEVLDVQRGVSTATVVGAEPEIIPPPTSTAEQQQFLQNYDAPQFWSNLDMPRANPVQPTNPDPELSVLLDHMEAEYEQFSSIGKDSNNGDLAIQQNGLMMLPENTTSVAVAEVMMSGQEETIHIDLLSPSPSVENRPLRNYNPEVVDLTMLD